MNDLLVMIQIAGRRCAIIAHDVQSVIELGNITPVPKCAPYVAGITAMRSKTLTVIDSRIALGLGIGDWPTDERAAVVAVDGHSYALIVDSIEDITTRLGGVQQVTGGFGEEWSRVADGMVETANGPVLLLDSTALISGPPQKRGEVPIAA